MKSATGGTRVILDLDLVTQRFRDFLEDHSEAAGQTAGQAAKQDIADRIAESLGVDHIDAGPVKPFEVE